MKTSESIKELVGALAECEFPMIEKNCTAEVYSERKGTKYTFKYADLADIIKVTKPVLKANGLAIIQTIHAIGEQSVLFTRLAHKSGDWIESMIAIPSYSKPQELGAYITYLRRYSYTAIIGVQSDDDTDGSTEIVHSKRTETPRVQSEIKPIDLDLVLVGKLKGRAIKALKNEEVVELANEMAVSFKASGYSSFDEVPPSPEKEQYKIIQKEILSRKDRA